jgi:ribosomal protein S27AE
MADLTASLPSTPRNGQFLAVYGKVADEGGGDIRVEVEECPECGAVVETSAGLAKHESWHAGQAGATPKSYTRST